MGMRQKKKSRSHKYDINIPRPRHGYEYTKYKMCLNMIMVLSIKQCLSKIWSSIHEKVKQHWSWDEKCVAYKKCVLYKREYFDIAEIRSIFGILQMLCE